jgi:hypothetical protein
LGSHITECIKNFKEKRKGKEKKRERRGKDKKSEERENNLDSLHIVYQRYH